MTTDTALPGTAVQIRASVEGRRLRLELAGGDRAFEVNPLPGKCGLALTRAFLAEPRGGGDMIPSDSVFAEALGPENYALVTGSHVQIFDEDGRYLRTALPDAVMVEPLDDVAPPVEGQRTRVVPATCDGLDLRTEEVEKLALAAFYWQSAAGSEALDAYLRGGAGPAGSAEARSVLEDALRRRAVLPVPPL